MISLVKIKHPFCWVGDEAGDLRLIQPLEYLRAFPYLDQAKAYKYALDHRTELPPQGVSPFAGFYTSNQRILRCPSSERQYELKGEVNYVDHFFSRISSLRETQFIKQLTAIGLIAPEVEEFFTYSGHSIQLRPWYRWWTELEKNLNDDVRTKVWTMLDKLDMYEIVSIPLED